MRTPASLFVVCAVLALGTPARAGTKVQMNLVPTPPDCFLGGGGCLNVELACGDPDNSECALGTLSAKSKVKLDGKGKLKATIKGVTDGTGALLTTGPAESDAGNLVLKLALTLCPVDTGAPPICDDVTAVYLKLVLTEGQAKLTLELASVIGATVGQSFGVLGVAVLGATSGVACPGTNSTADISARLNDATCDNGIVRGVGGLVAED